MRAVLQDAPEQPKNPVRGARAHRQWALSEFSAYAANCYAEPSMWFYYQVTVVVVLATKRRPDQVEPEARPVVGSSRTA